MIFLFSIVLRPNKISKYEYETLSKYYSIVKKWATIEESGLRQTTTQFFWSIGS